MITNPGNELLSERAGLPILYDRWLGELLQSPIPVEFEAPCDDCVMCKTPQREITESDVVFNEQTKCCTYFPYLPNFLVGKILGDPDLSFSAGRRAFLKQYQGGEAMVSPLGIDPPLSYQQQYVPNIQDFGRNHEMKCPYYLAEQGGACGIWKYRNSTCATWFCRYVKGVRGFAFWKAVDDLLTQVQRSLMRWCMRRLEVGDEALRAMFPQDDGENESLAVRFRRQMFFSKMALFTKMNDRTAFLDWQQQTWGHWFEKQSEYFQECAALVDNLDWDSVTDIGGMRIRKLAEGLQQAFRQMTTRSIPSRLKSGPVKKLQLNETRCLVWGYNRLHPLDLPRDLVDALVYFDGRETARVLAQIEEAKGVKFDAAMLDKLVDFQILVEAS